MLDQEFANKCLRELQEEFSEDKILREFLSMSFDGCGLEDEDIESAITDEYVDLVDSWATDNDMDYTEMFSFIMHSLDNDVEYDIVIDMNYDPEPYKTVSDKDPHRKKEVKFEYAVIVDDIRIGECEMHRSFEVV